MSKAGRQAGEGNLYKQMLLVPFCIRCTSRFQTKRNVFSRFTVATSPMLFSPIPPVHPLSTASKTSAGSVKYTLGRLDESVGPHLGFSAA